jgi:TIR domain/Pentapeptide repeats (8 copies)
MANEGHLATLQQGVEAWNAWRRRNPDIRPDISNTDLNTTDLADANVAYARLSRANFTNANLARADLTGADIIYTVFNGTVLEHTDLTQTTLMGTVFSQVHLGDCKGLERCKHLGPSSVDLETLRLSWPLPLAFLRGVGLPENVIDYLPSLLNQAIQMYSCFISYSSRDVEFAQRLHADLQNKGVRCWFAPHDMPIGAKILDALDEAIRHRDKLLLVLSENAIASDWVEDEVTKAFAEERQRQQLVLFPIRLDDAVLTTGEAWAGKLRDNRNIGDFRRWKEHDAYQKALERLLRDLRVEGS